MSGDSRSVAVIPHLAVLPTSNGEAVVGRAELRENAAQRGDVPANVAVSLGDQAAAAAGSCTESAFSAADCRFNANAPSSLSPMIGGQHQLETWGAPAGGSMVRSQADGASCYIERVAETEHSFRAPSAPLWRAEPFRWFFPLAIVLGWVGIGHWLLYASGATSTYSCLMHGLVQTQGFLMAFAIGFLFTAVPRRTQSASPSALEMLAAAALLAAVVAALVAGLWIVAELAYLLVFGVLLQFAARRLAGADAGRRPPAAFVLIPIGILHGIAGAVLLTLGLGATGTPAMTALGALFVEQGVFLCFAIGVGALILPLMAGAPPPRDLGSSPAEMRRAAAYGAVGVIICVSFLWEIAGHDRSAPLLRAVVVAAALGVGAGALRPPVKPGAHRRLAWVAVWLIPGGLALSSLLPDYRVPALHIAFIGGFSMLALAVATHVVLSHLGLDSLALGSPPAVVSIGLLLLLALAARFAADWSESYFAHLGWAAGLWIAATLVWLVFAGWRGFSHHRSGT